MTKLPEIRTNYGEGVGVEVFVEFPDLKDNQRTYLDADSAASAASFSADGVFFSTSEFIVVGQPGAVRTEILQVHTATAPTATTITLAVAATFAHNRGDVVRFIPYDKIVLAVSTDGGTNYVDQAAIAIRADSTETYIQRASDAATTYYKFRFYNSTTGNYSPYSDPVIATGFADNTIGAVKERALTQLGEVTDDGLVTDKFLNESIQEARRIADQNPAVFRWSFRTKFGQVISQMKAGEWSLSAPTDLRDRNTYKNILSLRMGNQNRPLVYQDRVRFNQNYLNVVRTTVATAYVSGGTSLVLSSTHDLDTTGSISIANNSVGDGLISVSYSANNKTTNTLTITNAGRNIAAGTNVWQRAVFGLPTAYTIDNGTIYLDVPLKTDYDGQDMKGDYYQAIQAITTDSQTFDEPFYDLYVPYLKFKIKYLKANGKIARDNDVDWKDWMAGLGSLIGQETPGQRVNFIPDIEGFLSATE